MQGGVTAFRGPSWLPKEVRSGEPRAEQASPAVGRGARVPGTGRCCSVGPADGLSELRALCFQTRHQVFCLPRKGAEPQLLPPAAAPPRALGTDGQASCGQDGRRRCPWLPIQSVSW